MLKRIRKLFRRDAEKPSAVDPPPSRKQAVGEANSVRPPVHQGPKAVHRPIPLSDLDPDAVKIVQRLTRFDHNAYLVGGCVRDLLLDLKPKDFDIGTSATPRQIKRVFRNCRIIGRRFRLAHIYFQNGKIIEVATFRAKNDEESNDTDEDGKRDLLIRDDNLFGTPEDDALRRDFTVNQLFYDINNETVIDHADGLGDLRRRLVRTIGDPEIRFREDPIRSLRAIRFAARLGMQIEAGTLAALENHRDDIPKAAAPRILEEINKLCRGGSACKSFELLRSTGVFDVILPELGPGYRKQADAWPFLMDLLGAFDEAHAESQMASTGSILVALLIPVIRESIGWNADGSIAKVKGTVVRETTDDLLRPLARRLRIARKDQEHCRQILVTLFRMLSTQRPRRNTRQAILQRDCLPAALRILQKTAARLGGTHTEAHTFWSRAAEEIPASDKSETHADRPESGERSGRRGSRKRRGGRGRGRNASSSQTESSSSSSRSSSSGSSSSRRSERPAPPSGWDDDYFFSALPTVPEEMAGDAGDRYGASNVTPGDQEAERSDPTEKPRAANATDATDSGGDAEKEDRPRRRRRSRRRRRPKSSGEEGSGTPVRSTGKGSE